MSILPFVASNMPTPAPRTRVADRPDRIEPYTPESTERDERTAREVPPPDFSALLALLGGPAILPPQRPIALVPATGEAVSVEDEPTVIVDEQEPDAESSTAALLDSDQRSLARTLRADALALARSEVLRINSEQRNVLAGLSNDPAQVDSGAAQRFGAGLTRSATNNDPRRDELLALSARAQSLGRGEPLARNDPQAAALRARIDSMLDIAGTAGGRALADTARPEFANAVAKSAADVTTAVRDIEALAPEFRARLDRIIDRMRDEFGHEVEVVETVRAPERQEHLFAQGRTAPGPVVTWTTNSAHLTGEAADVLIDGKWNHPTAYARLHEIAREEGVNTLGMRDPGHLELRGSATGGSTAASAQSAAAGAARFAQSGGIAQVASVARVAQVAQVAQVARPGSGARMLPTEPNSEPTAAPRLGDATIIASRAPMSSASGDRSGNSTPSGSDRERSSERDRSSVGAETTSAFGSLSSSVDRVLDGGAPRVAAPAGSTAAARAEAIAVLTDDAPVRDISSLTMHVESPDGPEQIRVNLRGGAVGAQVLTSNAGLADRLRMQTADLQDALGRHGLDTESLRVQQTSRTHEGDAVRVGLTDRAELLKAAAAGPGHQSSNDTGARERPTARQQPERERDSRDDADATHQQGRRNDRQENR